MRCNEKESGNKKGKVVTTKKEIVTERKGCNEKEDL
jgi:hypothetical protein